MKQFICGMATGKTKLFYEKAYKAAFIDSKKYPRKTKKKIRKLLDRKDYDEAFSLLKFKVMKSPNSSLEKPALPLGLLYSNYFKDRFESFGNGKIYNAPNV